MTSYTDIHQSTLGVMREIQHRLGPGTFNSNQTMMVSTLISKQTPRHLQIILILRYGNIFIS